MAADHRTLSVSRRRFVQGVGVAGLGLLAGCGRWPGQGQASPRVHRISYLSVGGPALNKPIFDALQQGLRELGWVEGQNIALEGRWADGQADRLPGLAGELVALPSDVIITFGDFPSQAAKDATSTIPIVFAAHADPVGTRLVDTFAHPGGNITGVSNMAPQLSGKRLDLLRETVPGLTRVGAIWNTAEPAMARAYGNTLLASETLGIIVEPLGVRTSDDLDRVYEAAIGRVDAVVVIADPLIARNRDRLVKLSTRSGLPTIHADAGFAAAGGLMSYGPNLARQAHRSAYYVDRILKGTKPADLPVEQPTTFDFMINLKTAQALGLTIPPHVLLQATEVIQ